MKNIISNFEKEQIRRLTVKKNIPNFRAGDQIKVNVKVVEGERSRIQSFEGTCIAKKNAGLNSSVTVRKISYGEGVERIFPFFSQIVDSIEIVKQGHVRRSKLYYLRNRSGKSTRITDKYRGEEKDQFESTGDIKEDLDNKEENNAKSDDQNLKNIKDKGPEEVKQNNQKSEISNEEKNSKNGDESEK